MILAVESSFDEVSVGGVRLDGSLMGHITRSSSAEHRETGGVVPEHAARSGSQHFPGIIHDWLTEHDLAPGDITALAVTVGPGLVGSLLLGVTTVKSLAASWNLPLIPVHHLYGHIVSALLDPAHEASFPLYPVVSLVASGGNTRLYRGSSSTEWEEIGGTIDDAIGEAFDKGARMLGYPYPGGRYLSEAGAEGDPTTVHFPRPMQRSGDLRMSFSGIKTALKYHLRDHPNTKKEDLAASYERALVDSLLHKLHLSTHLHAPVEIWVGGGVAANKPFREGLQDLALQSKTPVRIAPMAYCTDNASMIALAALHQWRANPSVTSWGWKGVDIALHPDLVSLHS